VLFSAFFGNFRHFSVTPPENILPTPLLALSTLVDEDIQNAIAIFTINCLLVFSGD